MNVVIKLDLVSLGMQMYACVGACLSQRVLFLSHMCGQGEYTPQYSHTHQQAEEGVLFLMPVHVFYTVAILPQLATRSTTASRFVTAVSPHISGRTTVKSIAGKLIKRGSLPQL